MKTDIYIEKSLDGILKKEEMPLRLESHFLHELV